MLLEEKKISIHGIFEFFNACSLVFRFGLMFEVNYMLYIKNEFAPDFIRHLTTGYATLTSNEIVQNQR